MPKSKTDKEKIYDVLLQARAGVSAEELCQRYGIDASTLQQWQQEYSGEKFDALAREILWGYCCLTLAVLVCIFLSFYAPLLSFRTTDKAFAYIEARFVEVVAAAALLFIAVLFPKVYVGVLSIICAYSMWKWGWEDGGNSLFVYAVTIGLFATAVVMCLKQSETINLVLFFLCHTLLLLLLTADFQELQGKMLWTLSERYLMYPGPGAWVTVGFFISSFLQNRFDIPCRRAFTVFLYSYLFFFCIFLTSI